MKKKLISFILVLIAMIFFIVGSAMALTVEEVTSFGSYPNWRAVNTTSSGTVVISNEMPRDGDGSLRFNLPNSSSRADVLLGGTTGFWIFTTYDNLGLLSGLNSMSFDWYRDDESTAGSHFIPTFRVFVRDGSTNYQYVWEDAYNGYSGRDVTDQWVTQVLLPEDNWYLSNQGNTGPYDRSLGQYGANNANNVSSDAFIYGFSVALGSGWGGSWLGYVDNITLNFGDDATTRYNFNVTQSYEPPAAPIPEPGTIALLGIGLAGLGLYGYRRKNKA